MVAVEGVARFAWLYYWLEWLSSRVQIGLAYFATAPTALLSLATMLESILGREWKPILGFAVPHTTTAIDPCTSHAIGSIVTSPWAIGLDQIENDLIMDQSNKP